MLNKENYDYLERRYGDIASWAIWADATDTPRSNTGDLTVFDAPDLLEKLNPDYVFVGLNASSTHGDLKTRAGRPWYNFHSDYARQNDFKLRYALKDTPYWGAYITDAIKEYPEVDSGKVVTYIRQHPEIIRKNIEILFDELAHLAETPILIALGDEVYRLLTKHLDGRFKIVRIKHYAAYIGKEAYREELLQIMSRVDSCCGQPDIEQIIRETTEENPSKTDWTKAWSTKYPILKTYQAEVDIPYYATQIRAMLTELRATYGYSEQNAMLVLKDILAHEYMDKKKGK